LVNQCALLDRLDSPALIAAVVATLDVYITLYDSTDARPSQVAAAVLTEKIPALTELIEISSGYTHERLEAFVPRVQCAAAAAQLVRGDKWGLGQSNRTVCATTDVHSVQTPVSLPAFMLDGSHRSSIDVEIPKAQTLTSVRNAALEHATTQPLLQPHAQPPVLPAVEPFLLARLVEAQEA
jgi:hypothetical protein